MCKPLHYVATTARQKDNKNKGQAANGYELETPDWVADDDYPIQMVLFQVSSGYQGVFPSFGHQLLAHRGLPVT